MLTLRDRLSRLTIRQAEKLLGPAGNTLIIAGGKREINPAEQVELSSNVLRLKLPAEDAIVSILEDDHSIDKMRFFCSACEGVCEHIGAAFSLALEEKALLGLSTPPPENEEPMELTENELVTRELMRREDRSRQERLRMKSIDPSAVWTDYVVTNIDSGKSYRVALRGWERGDSYCSCPDFRKNTLGTCKHIMFVIREVQRNRRDWKKCRAWTPDRLAVHLRYGSELSLRLDAPAKLDAAEAAKLGKFIGGPIADIAGLMKAIGACAAEGIDVLLYPDAEEYIRMALHRSRISQLVGEMRRAPSKHPLLRELLKIELLPYQLEGIAFAVGTGRAVLADDMGLGKTIQGIGAAELYARECGITKVLIVTPASVKSQWRNEITRFTGKEALIVAGTSRDRLSQYQSSAFYTICNYEQIMRDLQSVEKARWDFIILDEGQRIKNWEAKTSRTIKALRSPYALVLSGTPLENRLEELYSVVEFIDDRRLGPAFRFEQRHKIATPGGRVLGYKNLDTLREMLRPVLLRRTRDAVIKQLPPRTTEIVRVMPTAEQAGIHDENLRVVALITRKKFITEVDLLRMQKALLMCRMSADSTFLCNKETPAYSSKLERLAELLPQLASESDRKIILFSEWTTMLDLIEKTVLKPNGLRYVRLDGSVPQKKRQALVTDFQNDPAIQFFITTNAGSTGLNLQAANTVVNVDLPWNPAVLDQRIGRAHRMGQKRPVQVYLMVTERTLEEKMLSTLSAKKDLSLAALDSTSDVTKIDLRTGIDELKRRLEVLLGDKPAAPLDVSEQQRVEAEAHRLARKQRIEDAGGKLLLSAIGLLGEMMPAAVPVASETIEQAKTSILTAVEKDESGGYALKLRLPDEAAFESFARSMAAFMQAGMGAQAG
jgi:superfamily II DNA or RNA helicase